MDKADTFLAAPDKCFCTLLTRRAGLVDCHHITKLIIHLDNWK